MSCYEKVYKFGIHDHTDRAAATVCPFCLATNTITLILLLIRIKPITKSAVPISHSVDANEHHPNRR